jgi:hypothetical protein
MTMKLSFRSAALALALALLACGPSAAYAASGHPSGGGGGGGGSGGSSHPSGGSSSFGGNAIHSNSSGSISSNVIHNNGGNVIKNNGSNGVISNNSGGSGSIHINSSNKAVLKSNPAPKTLNTKSTKNVLSDKDHSKDHSSKSTSHDPSNHSDKIKHFHSNPKYTYHHEHGHSWDKDEWAHCWNRWWCFHNSHIFLGGVECWWDPDVSQWCVYNEGDSIPEDYLVKDETPPAVTDSIRIAHAADAEAPLSYALNEYSYQIEPGDHQDLTTDRTWVIAFNRGGDFGDAEYTLESGTYTFGPSDHGWELFHTSAADESSGSSAEASRLPKNPLPK